MTVADTTPRSANTSIARSSTSSAVAPLRVPTRQASKQQIEMDSRRNNPAVISSVPIIKIRISGKQNAASTAATPERAVPPERAVSERNLERRRGEAPVSRSDWWVVFRLNIDLISDAYHLLVLIVLIPFVRKRRHLKPRSILIVKLELFIIYANKLSHSPRLNYEIVAIGKSLQLANR